MKKLLVSACLAFLLTALCVIPALADGIADFNYEDISGMFEFTDETAECLVPVGDCCVGSDYWLDPDQPFVYSADTVMTGGTGALGLMLITGDCDDPIGTGCIIQRTDFGGQTNLWTLNTAGYSFSSWVNYRAYELGETMHYDMVYDGAGNFFGYVNGELYHECYDTGFEGAYVGLLAWSASGTYSNVVLSHDISAFSVANLISEKEAADAHAAEVAAKAQAAAKPTADAFTGEKEDLMERFTQESAFAGTWDFSKTEILSDASNEAIVDSFVVPDIYVEGGKPFVYSADIVTNGAGGAVGLMLAEGDDRANPIGTGCVYYRTGADGIVTLGTVNSPSLNFFDSMPLPFNYAVGDVLHYDLVYDGCSAFYCYVNDQLTIIQPNETFAGAYLSLLSWCTYGSYKNLTLSYDVSSFLDLSVFEETAPAEEAPVEEAPVEVAPVEEAPVEEAVVEAVEEAPVETVEVPAAPQTFDGVVIAALAAVLSSTCAVLLKKKEH